MICECDCENGGEGYEINSAKCNFNGDLSCGICKCKDGFFGKNCECGGGKGLYTINEFACRYNNATQDCSGRGHCECNECMCDPPPGGDPEEVCNKMKFKQFHFMKQIIIYGIIV